MTLLASEHSQQEERANSSRPRRASLPGPQKAARLMVALGPVQAAEIFRRIPPRQARALAAELAATSGVEPEEQQAILEELVELVRVRGYIAEGGLEYARAVLTRALGLQRADELLERVAATLATGAFDFLATVPPDQVAVLLDGESPQVAALVLASMPRPELAGRVLETMPLERQAEVAKRVALMGALSPDVVEDVARVMEGQLGETVHTRPTVSGGVERLAELLTAGDRTTERTVLEGLDAVDPELADAVRALLFAFEDLVKLDDRSIQLVLKESDGKDLAVALRGASDALHQRIVSNLSQRAAQLLREEMEYMPPQRRRVVEEAQSRIVATVRRLEEAGAIVVPRGGDEDELVP